MQGFSSPDVGSNGLEGLGPLFATGAFEHICFRNQLYVHESNAAEQVQVLSI